LSHGRRCHLLCLWQPANAALLRELSLKHGQHLRGRFHGCFFTNHLSQFHVPRINGAHVAPHRVHQDFRILRIPGHLRHLFGGIRSLVHLVFKPGEDARVKASF